MSDIFDVLEICLQEIENGADVESVLARYPHFAAELRPILKTSVVARSMSAPDPSPDTVRRGRAKVLQHAAQMRETKAAPRSKRMLPIFQRLAIAVTLAAIFLASGTGLVSASASALPGENMYPVKLTWENLRLFFTFDEEYREILEHTFENERLHEVNELLVEGRHETIQFAGVYMEVNGVTYVSGIHVVVLETSILPTEPLSNGAAVVVTGHTNAEGFVDVESIELLPAGSIVPVGPPVEVETDHNGNANDNENSGVDDNDNSSGDDDNGNLDNNSNDDNGNVNADADENENNVDDGNSNENENDSNTNDNNTNDENDDNSDSGSGDNSGSGGGDDGGGGDGGDDSGGDDDGDDSGGDDD